MDWEEIRRSTKTALELHIEELKKLGFVAQPPNLEAALGVLRYIATDALFYQPETYPLHLIHSSREDRVREVQEWHRQYVNTHVFYQGKIYVCEYVCPRVLTQDGWVGFLRKLDPKKRGGVLADMRYVTIAPC